MTYVWRNMQPHNMIHNKMLCRWKMIVIIEHIMKHLIIQFPPDFCYFLSLWSKYPPQHCVPKHPQYVFLRQEKSTVCWTDYVRVRLGLLYSTLSAGHSNHRYFNKLFRHGCRIHNHRGLQHKYHYIRTRYPIPINPGTVIIPKHELRLDQGTTDGSTPSTDLRRGISATKLGGGGATKWLLSAPISA
jgi:hypothetical protein